MKRKILIVDSELSIRMMLVNFLSDDYEVTAVENCYEAISRIQQGNCVDLLLVDLNMSMTNDYDFEKCIKKQNGMSAVQVITFSTANNRFSKSKTTLIESINIKELKSKISSAFRKVAA